MREEPAVSQEHAVITADGSLRSLRWRNRAICDEHGEVVSLQGYGEDVTAQRPAELKLGLVTETIRRLSVSRLDEYARCRKNNLREPGL